MREKTDIKSMNLAELTAFVESMGVRPFRAKQMYEWMHQKLAGSIDEMTNLSKEFRERLKQECAYTTLEQLEKRTSRQDGIRKYVFGLFDGNVIESVYMRYRFGGSVCISSQAGCRMGCKFCASGMNGLERSLTPSEMLEQVYAIQRDVGERISHVVVMGIGEPLDNYDNLLRFIEMISDEHGLHISQRNLTVSTCGIVPKIRELAGEGLKITLALSLHASTQKARQELMPIASKYALQDTIGACYFYFQETGRRMTFEYSLIEGVNDTDEDAGRLAELLSGTGCHVNLIPVNPVKEHMFAQPSKERALAFQNKLEKYGIHVTIRREMGRDIDAACGQLRKKHIEGRWGT